MSAPRLAVVAVGGNALIRDRQHESIPDQFEMVSGVAERIADLAAAGWHLVVTHGNGPQVGFVLRRSELATGALPPVPMDYAGADIQGSLGWMFARALHNAFCRHGIRRDAAALVTQTVVERADPAFAEPSKPIGSPLDEAQAHRMVQEHGWTVRDEPGRGWRRVVPSPRPRAIVEAEVIRRAAADGTVVVACGGGGIPVVEDREGYYQGVEAVVDKDLASALLARTLRAHALIILTGVEKVALDFNRPTQRWLDRMTLAEARRHVAAGHFDPGSMGPKVEALIEFVGAGGALGLVTDAPNLERALRGDSGTRVLPD